MNGGTFGVPTQRLRNLLFELVSGFICGRFLALVNRYLKKDHSQQLNVVKKCISDVNFHGQW